jgi:hypothetical protein
MPRGTRKQSNTTKKGAKSRKSGDSATITIPAPKPVTTRSKTARKNAQNLKTTAPELQNGSEHDIDMIQNLETRQTRPSSSKSHDEQRVTDSAHNHNKSHVPDDSGNNSHNSDESETLNEPDVVSASDKQEADEVCETTESSKLDELQSTRAQGDSWLPWQDRALAEQVNSERPFSAGHGQVGAAWERVAQGLAFKRTGDGCKKRFNLLLGRHKVFLLFTLSYTLHSRSHSQRNNLKLLQKTGTDEEVTYFMQVIRLPSHVIAYV